MISKLKYGFFLFFIPQILQAQLIEIPASNLFILEQAHASGVWEKAKEKNGNMNTLPFFEDFQIPGPYPTPLKWEQNQVFVNRGMGKTPPSVGVATFDGLDSKGSPYGGGFGPSDTLTSLPFDLSGYNPSDSLYLSYYIQAKGFGDKPETADALILEFKNNSGVWVQQANYPGLGAIPADFIPDFEQYFKSLNNTAYLHSSFQFRFRNLSNRSGFIDNWNLDYIRMDAGRTLLENSNSDIAFTAPPLSILNTYTGLPLKHFLANLAGELQLEVIMDVTNHFGSSKSIGPRNIIAIEKNTSTTVLPLKDFGQTNFTAGQNLSISDQLNLNVDFNFGALPVGLVEADIELMSFFAENNPVQLPEYKLNDTVRTTTYFRKYFSYDDGSAESNIVAQGQGVQVAIKFHANVADTIRGVQFHFPYVQGSVESQEFNIKVWIGDLNNATAFNLNFQNPQYRDTLNGFTTYIFDELVPLQSGADFFVGWQQFTQAANSIPVGFDKNHPDASQFAYLNLGGLWEPFPESLKGALMIRPLMGSELLTSVSEPFEDQEGLKVYPNPVSNFLNIDLENSNYQDYKFRVYDSFGRLLISQAGTEKIYFGNLPAGIYIFQALHLPTQKNLQSQKIIKFE